MDVYYWRGYDICRMDWAEKSSAASRREDKAKSLLDKWILSCSEKTDFPIHEPALVPAKVHLTTACWSTFRKYALSKGVQVGRRVATKEERIAAKDYRKGKLYVVWARLQVHPSQAVEFHEKKQAKAKETTERRKQKKREREEQKAHERFLKRIRLDADEDAGAMAETALEIAMAHRLQEDLADDPFSLYCMKQTCKLFHKVANKIAANKMESLTVSFGGARLTPRRDRDNEIVFKSDRILEWRGKGDCGQEIPFTLSGYTQEILSTLLPGLTLKHFSFESDVKIVLPSVRHQPESCCLDGKGYAIEYKVTLFVGENEVSEYKLELKQVKIDFSYLVGKYAWRHAPYLTYKYERIQEGRGKTGRGSRALTNHEKEYMNLLMFAKTFA